MKNTIVDILNMYGFKARAAEFVWGVGSLAWGHTISVKALGNDFYEITIKHWFCNPSMELVRDTNETKVLHGALALSWIFKEAPSSFWPH